MEAQANTTREQSNKKKIGGWQPSHGANGGVEKKNVFFSLHLSKYIDSDHLCYIYVDTFTSTADLSPENQNLVL